MDTMRAITVKLTALEAEELLYAAGNILDAGGEEEVLDFYAGEKRRRKCCISRMAQNENRVSRGRAAKTIAAKGNRAGLR